MRKQSKGKKKSTLMTDIKKLVWGKPRDWFYFVKRVVLIKIVQSAKRKAQNYSLKLKTVFFRKVEIFKKTQWGKELKLVWHYSGRCLNFFIEADAEKAVDVFLKYLKKYIKKLKRYIKKEVWVFIKKLRKKTKKVVKKELKPIFNEFQSDIKKLSLNTKELFFEILYLIAFRFETQPKAKKRKRRKISNSKQVSRRFEFPIFFSILGYQPRIAIIIRKVPRRFWSPFKKHWQEIVAVFLLFAMLSSSFLFYKPRQAQAAIYTFTQTDWSGGATTTVAVHPTNQTNWTYYESSASSTPDTSGGKLGISGTAAGFKKTFTEDFTATTYEDTTSTTAFWDTTNGQVTFNTTTEGELSHLGNYSTSKARNVAVSGNYAYVADESLGVKVVDISDPASPVYKTTIVVNPAINVTVSGDYLYIPTCTDGLYVFDISNPLMPQQKAHYQGSSVDAYYDVAISGNYAYVANDENGLDILDISDIANGNISYVSSLNASTTYGTSTGITVSGNYAYLADGPAGMRIIDISDPTNPTTTATFNTYNAQKIAVSGNYAYIADHAGGLVIVDISSSTAPAEAGAWGAPEGYAAMDVAVLGDFAFVANYGAGVYVLNIADPSNIFQKARYDTSGSALGIAVPGDIYVADYSNGLEVFRLRVSDTVQSTVVDDIRDPETIFSVAFETTDTIPAGTSLTYYVSADGGTSWEAISSGQVYTFSNYGPNLKWKAVLSSDYNTEYEFTNQPTPTITNVTITYYYYDSIFDTYNAQKIAVSSNYAYIADHAGGLVVVDISSSTNPIEAGAWGAPEGHAAMDVALDGNYAYVANYGAGIYKVDVSNSSSPTLSASSTTNGSALGVAVDDNYVYVADYSGGLKVFDKATLTLQNSGQDLSGTINKARDITVSGNYAYIADESNGVRVVDISSSTNPTLNNTISVPNAIGVTISGNYLYIAGCTDGLYIYNISDPTNPTLAGTYSGSSVDAYYDVAISGNYAYLANDQNSLDIIDVSSSTNPVFTRSIKLSGGGIARGVTVSASGDIYLADGAVGMRIIRDPQKNIIAGQTLTLISSPYDTTQETNVIVSISWTENIPGDYIKFQLRTASTSEGLASSSFVGPDGTSNSYFTDPSGGEAIPSSMCDAVGDRWFQYKVILTSDEGDVPELYDVTITYGVNAPPVVSSVSISQNASTTVDITYYLNDENEAGEDGEVEVYFFYNLNEIVLAQDISASQTEIPVSDASSLLATGTIQIDNEVISYSGKSGNTLTGCTRGYWPGSESYSTRATTHSEGTKIYIKTADSATDGEGVKTGITNTPQPFSANWDPKQDPGVGEGQYFAGAEILISVNDGNTAYQLGTGSGTFELDTEKPTAIFGVDASTQWGGNPATLHITTDDETMTAGSEGWMRFSLSEEELLTLPWQQYTATATIMLETTTTDTVYLQLKDAKGNVSDVISGTTPEIPQHLMIQDTSNMNVSPPDYRLFIAWEEISTPPSAAFYHYNILKAQTNDDAAYQEIGHTIGPISLNYYNDPVAYETVYYYKVTAEDANGNVSFRSDFVYGKANGIQDYGEGGGGTDEVPPTISNVATSSVTQTSIKVTWTTDELSNSYVFYKPTTEATYSSQGPAGYVTSHEVIVSGLNAGTTYDFYVQSSDPSGNSATSSVYQFTTLAGDTTPPTITSGPTVATTTYNSATITWTTDEESSSYVEYSTISGFAVGAMYGQDDSTTSHSVTLPNILSASTTYYFKVHSKDAAGNEVVSPEQNFTTQSAPAEDNTPPEITDVTTSSIAYNTATITWTTDEPSSSFVEFGKTTAYGRIYGQDDLVTSHSVTLPKDLSPSTLYHFRVRSVDVAGNEGISNDYTFTTVAAPDDNTPPTISNITITNPTQTSVTISWTTDEDANSYIGYSQDHSYLKEQGSPVMTTSHTVELVGLQPATQYYFQVKSTDPSGNTTTTDKDSEGNYLTFSTSPGTPPPVISNVEIVDVGSNSATIQWDTDVVSTSFVEYGLDTSYGKLTGQNDSVTSHSVELIGLLSDATYHFRVRSAISGSEAVSQDYTFTTGQAADITPPIITNVATSSVSLNSATITWTTDENSNSIVDYGTSTANLNFLAGQTDESVTSHSVTLTGLTASTTYYFQVRSQDSSGNTATDNNSGNYYTFTTLKDTTPPNITSGPTAVVVSDTKATITWETDELSTSQVLYGTTDSYGSQTIEDTTLTYQHSVTITGLTKQTTYHYQVVSKDAAGNSTSSQDNTFTTTDEPGIVETIRVGGGGILFVEKTAKPDTTPPIITNIEVKDISYTSVTITWRTNEPTDTFIEYGLTQQYEKGSFGNPHDSVTLHSLTLTSLSSGTEYHFRVLGKDSYGNLGFSADKTFTTLEVGAAVPEEAVPEEEKGLVEKAIDILTKLSNPHSVASVSEALEESAQRVVGPPLIAGEYPQVEVGPDWARITWVTDKKSNSLVAYAKEGEHDPTKEEPYTIEVGNSKEQVTTHIVELTGLQPSTTYHYQVRSKGKIGDWAKSEDKTFTTLSLKPEISQIEFISIKETQATLTWQTSLPTKTKILLTNLETGEEKEIEDPSFLKFHTFTLENLQVSTNYTIQITSEDERGNKSTSSIIPFSTSISKNPPVISNIRITTSLIPGRIERVQAIITWKTDKPSTSRVYYQEGITTKEELPFKTPLNKKLTTEHIVITTTFKPGKVYQFKVESIDSFNNRSLSKLFTILTPQPKQSVVDLIIKNFEETFGFLKRLKF